MFNEETTIHQEARIIAAALTAPKFRGRTKLLELANRNNSSALLALEMTAEKREQAALRSELSYDVIKALDLPSVREQARLHESRIAARTYSDPIAERKMGNVLCRAVVKAFCAALDVADFRMATHSHKSTVRFVEPGQETACSESGQTRPSSVGLPNAYANKGYFVTTSSHTFLVSVIFLGLPKSKRAARGVIYLTPSIRVRQARGAQLILEQYTLVGKRGKWA